MVRSSVFPMVIFLKKIHKNHLVNSFKTECARSLNWRFSTSVNITMDFRTNLFRQFLSEQEQGLPMGGYREETPFYKEDYKEEIQDKTMHVPFADQTEDFFKYYDNCPPKEHFFFTPNSPRSGTSGLNYGCERLIRTNDGQNRQSPLSKRLTFSQDESLEENNQFEEVSDSQQRAGEKSGKMAKGCRSRNMKGLKTLSASVYEIVSQMRVTSYKQVADKLVEELKAGHHSGIQHLNMRDQHNIKRRVYDALNVLISANLLCKRGKIVSCNYPLSRENKHSFCNSKLKKKHEALQEQIKNREKVLQQKRELKEKLQRKKQLVACIINRNKVQCHEATDYIHFPCFGLKVGVNTSFSLTQEGQVAVVELSTRFEEIIGDIDLLLQVDRQNAEMNSLLRQICATRIEEE